MIHHSNTKVFSVQRELEKLNVTQIVVRFHPLSDLA
jgi:hypothetical protein